MSQSLNLMQLKIWAIEYVMKPKKASCY